MTAGSRPASYGAASPTIQRSFRRPGPLPTPEAESRPVHPSALFSLVSGWNPSAPDKLLLRPLSTAPIALGVGGKKLGRRYVTANWFEVAARVADRFARAGLKIIIFCDSIPTCVSTAKSLNTGQDGRTAVRDTEQDACRASAIAELGSSRASMTQVSAAPLSTTESCCLMSVVSWSLFVS